MAAIWCTNKHPWCFHFIYYTLVLLLAFLKNKVGSMLAQGFLRVKGQAQITKSYFLWVGAINMQSLSGHYLMRLQVPMVFFTSFSLSRYCCLHFCRNKFGLILAQGYFTDQRSSIIHKLQLFMTLCNTQLLSGHYLKRHQVPMVSLLL